MLSFLDVLPPRGIGLFQQGPSWMCTSWRKNILICNCSQVHQVKGSYRVNWNCPSSPIPRVTPYGSLDMQAFLTDDFSPRWRLVSLLYSRGVCREYFSLQNWAMSFLFHALQPVGCDGSLYSAQTMDRCRVCGGDGSTCYRVSGSFRKGISQLGTPY